jgi:fatty-acyl-CoA synthase
MTNNGLGAWLAKRRIKHPDRVALYFNERAMSFRELADSVDALAATLHSRGIARGERVAYLGENTPEFLETLFACARLGAVFVPINTRLAAPEVGHILSDSGARVLFFDQHLAAIVDAASSGNSELESIRTRGHTLDGSNPSVIPEASGYVAEDVHLDEPALIMYTSGTTGCPKGVVLSHGNLTFAALNAAIDYDMTSEDVALLISPLFHAASLGMGALPMLLQGGTIVLEPRFEPALALHRIGQYRVTMLSGVPTTYQMLADHPDWERTELGSLRKLTCGGSAVPERILNAYESRGLRFSQGYGMTEAGPGVTALSPEMTLSKPGSVGLPHFFTDVRVTEMGGQPASLGQVGEIEVRGSNLFSGYHNQAEATAAAFTDDGWFRTGDLGYLDEDGYLYIADRLKDMIISGGENVYPAEIENLINNIPGVTGVAVIGVPDAQWGEVPCAVVTLGEGSALSLEDVRNALDGSVARFKLPKRLELVDEFPRTGSGKIQKADLRKRFAAS